MVLAAFVAAIASLATARADDLLDRAVLFHISSSPLAGALIEFSAQSGIQVAAADADVSRFNSHGVNGTYPIYTALSLLLNGTGLEFLRVGTETVVVRTASTVPPMSAPAGEARPGAATRVQTGRPTQPDSATNAGDLPQLGDVTVTAPRPPTEEELKGDSLYQFIVHHATVHSFSTGTEHNLALWRGGMQSICPSTAGLDPGYNAFITARLRALAAYVGAPLQSDPHCKNNVSILFTNNPQQSMEYVVKWAGVYFRNRYAGGTKRLIEYKGDHAIQGWYMETTGGAVVLNTDVTFVGLNVLPLWPQITPRGYGGNGIGTVFLIVDTSKVAGYTIGTLADYLSMLTLSVVQSPNYCDPLPSILDLMSSSCGTRQAPTAMTAGDLAFLKALYYKNTGLGGSLSRDEIRANMLRQFNPR